MRFNIARIWLMWLLVMAVPAGVMWVLFMFPLPGGNSGVPTLGEVLELFAHLGVGQTIMIFAVVLLPPLLLTCFEIWKGRQSRGLAPATEAVNFRGFWARRSAPRITVTVDPDRFRFEGPGVREGTALEAPPLFVWATTSRWGRLETRPLLQPHPGC